MTVQFDIGATVLLWRRGEGWVAARATHPGATSPDIYVVKDPVNAQRLVYAMNKAEAEEREARTLAVAVRKAKQDEAIAKWCVT